MIMKPLKNRGKGSASAVLRYLLDKPDGQKRILKGDPELSQRIAESLSYQHKYEAWVLSFEEKGDEVSEETKLAVIAEFERAFLPYFQDDPSRYNITWIEHTDKDGRLELNFFFPKVDLLTEKQIPLYNKSRQADVELANNFRDYINDQYGFSNPLDPSKAKLVKASDFLHKAKSDKALKNKELIDGITQSITQLVQLQKIHNRDDVIKTLESVGYEVTRVRKDSVSIKNPNGGQNLKISGVLFNEQFKSVNAASEYIEARARNSVSRENREIERNGRQRDQEFSRTHGNAPRSDYSEFQERLEESIEYRRKTQQRAFGELSGRGRAFGIIAEERISNVQRNHTKDHRIEHTSERNLSGSHRAERIIDHSTPNQGGFIGSEHGQPVGNGSLENHVRTLEIPVYRISSGFGLHGSFSGHESSERERSPRIGSQRDRAEYFSRQSSVASSEQTSESANFIVTETNKSGADTLRGGARTLQPAISEQQGIGSENLSNQHVQRSSPQTERLHFRGTPKSMYNGRKGQSSSANEFSGKIRNLSGDSEVNVITNDNGTLRQDRSDTARNLERLRGNLTSIGERTAKYREFGRESEQRRGNGSHFERNSKDFGRFAQFLADTNAINAINTELRKISAIVGSIGERVEAEVRRIIEQRNQKEPEISMPQTKPNAPKMRM